MKYTIFSVLTLMLAANINATENHCSINAMNGVWTSYQGAVLGNPHTGACTFKLANGLAQGTCDFSTGFKGPFQGEVVVNKDCSVNFDMDFAPAPVVSKFQIQLHKDKQSFVGRWSNNFGVIGVTNAVKR